MKTKAFLWLAMFGALHVLQAEPVGKLIDSKTCGDYKIRIHRDVEETGAGSFQISKGTKIFFEGTGFSFEFWNGTTSNGKIVPLVGEDLTISGNPHVVIHEWTGGMHCCYSAKVFRLGSTVELIATIEAQHSGELPLFFQTAPDQPWHVRVQDWTFAYWPHCFATSYAPEIVLKWDGARYVVDQARTYKPATDANELAKLAATLSREDWGNPESYFTIPRKLYSTAIDLMYTGHEELGWKFLREGWNPRYPKYEEFASMLRTLRDRSPYWPQLK